MWYAHQLGLSLARPGITFVFSLRFGNLDLILLANPCHHIRCMPFRRRESESRAFAGDGWRILRHDQYARRRMPACHDADPALPPKRASPGIQRSAE
jgi:hypothetical protein